MLRNKKQLCTGSKYVLCKRVKNNEGSKYRVKNCQSKVSCTCRVDLSAQSDIRKGLENKSLGSEDDKICTR
jgi:hypothetical protein